jgi:hypothetical protein
LLLDLVYLINGLLSQVVSRVHHLVVVFFFLFLGFFN